MSAAILTVETRTDTPFVPTPSPRLSWKIDTLEADWIQAWAEVRSGDETHRVEGRESNLVAWPFAPLTPGAQAAVQVRVAATSGTVTGWSEPVAIRAGFLSDDAEWGVLIGLADPERHAHPVELRHEFEASDVTRATLFWTAQGVAEVRLNGESSDDAVLAPGWPTYPHRLLHETTDVTRLIRDGANAIAVRLAGCWFTESYGFHGQDQPLYGTQPSFAARLELERADGSVHAVLTGADWRADGNGPLVSSGLYEGETYDARLIRGGWDLPGYDDSAWPNAAVVSDDFHRPQPQLSPPVRRIEEVGVAEVLTTPSGATVLDFGQNLVGRLRIRVTGDAGHTVTLRHAEVMEHDELGTRPLRRASATDHFTLSGEPGDVYEPSFTFHGFRYAQVDNWPGALDPAAVTAVVLHNDLDRTGEFTTSHELIAQLHSNVSWGMRGNFLAIPTACPQRDERLGWTGDICVFAPTATRLYDVRGFLRNWLRDLAADQRAADGQVPLVIPSVLQGQGPFGDPTAVWGDAATVVPWTLHERYGDLGVLEEAYPSMKAWLKSVLADTEGTDLWTGRMQLGDWLDPTAPPDNPAQARTSTDVVASAYLVLSAGILAKSAALLGYHDDAATYAAQAERSRGAFAERFITGSGWMTSDAQTAYALALCFDLVPPELAQPMADRLAELVRENGYHIATGFVGTPLVVPALSRYGHLEEAERLLLQTGCPSWLYPVTMGATTVWERWDSMLQDGTINPGEMTSFNHYALGAVADWLHGTVAGLEAAEPGYRTLRIQPHPLRRLDDARSTLETPYGRAEVGWARHGDEIVVDAVVPPNVTATVVLAGREEVEVGSGRHTWTFPDRPALPSRRPFTLRSPAADVIDDEEALAAVIDALEESAPWLADGLTRRVNWGRRRPLSNAFLFAPPEVLDKVSAALNRLAH